MLVEMLRISQSFVKNMPLAHRAPAKALPLWEEEQPPQQQSLAIQQGEAIKGELRRPAGG